MKDLKAYWARIRALTSQLRASHPEGLFLSTLKTDNGTEPGHLAKVTPEVAAKCIANGTHEIATPEQIERHNAVQQRERRELRARVREANGQGDVIVLRGEK